MAQTHPPGSPSLRVLIERLQARLDAHATPEAKAWWEAYLKNVISFRGAKMGDIRQSVHSWFTEERLGQALTPAQQKTLALDLLEEPYAEDKLAGILFLQEILLPAGEIDYQTDVPRFGRLFSDGHIYDWSVCDWFCVKVLGPLVQRYGVGCAQAIAEWRHAEHLWQRRASVVAFVDLAKDGDANFPGFTEMVLANCAALVRSNERFAQTGTGWVLRELGRADEQRVIQFIETHVGHFSAEGLRYATEKMSSEVKKDLRGTHRQRIAELRSSRSEPS